MEPEVVALPYSYQPFPKVMYKFGAEPVTITEDDFTGMVEAGWVESPADAVAPAPAPVPDTGKKGK